MVCHRCLVSCSILALVLAVPLAEATRKAAVPSWACPVTKCSRKAIDEDIAAGQPAMNGNLQKALLALRGAVNVDQQVLCPFGGDDPNAKKAGKAEVDSFFDGFAKAYDATHGIKSDNKHEETNVVATKEAAKADKPAPVALKASTASAAPGAPAAPKASAAPSAPGAPPAPTAPAAPAEPAAPAVPVAPAAQAAPAILAASAPGAVQKVDRQSLIKLADAHDQDLLVVFYAPWCPHCQAFVLAEHAPLDQLARELAAVNGPKVVSFDTTASPMPSRWQANFIPTILLVSKDGRHSEFVEDPSEVEHLKAFALAGIH